MRILLVVYDNGSYISFFPQGLAYISAVMKNLGHDVVIYNQDITHKPDSDLTQYLDDNYFDIVGISIIGGYYQYKKLLSLCNAINTSKNRPNYLILGGHLVTPDPAYFLKKTNADIIVMGEGEETIEDIFYNVMRNLPLSDIKGIAYRNGSEYKINPRRELIQNIDTIQFPDYEAFPIDHYKLIRFVGTDATDFCMPVLSGRGCTFKCNFCYRQDKGFRPRKTVKILEEIEYLKSKWGINYILFSDELLMSSEERTIEISEAIIKSKLNIKWSCNGRLNYATDEVLKIMKEAGCTKVNYGIESFDDKMLKVMKKSLNTKQIVKGVENTLKHGITPGLNIIFGNIGETREVLMKGVKFILKYGDHKELRTVRPVTPYPGCPLYYNAIEKGLIKDIEDFYENKCINSDLLSVNFTDMTDDEFHKCLHDANQVLLDDYYENMKQKSFEQLENLYIKKDTSFRGFRQV